MKKQIYWPLLIALFLLTANSKVQAEVYLGEFCWQVFNPQGEPYWSYQFGLYEKEGGHFALYGSVYYDQNGPSASHGNAILIGNKVKMTIVSSDYEEGYGVWSETFSALLNQATLNGTWNSLSLEIDDGVNLLPVHQEGTIDNIPCL